MPPTPIAYFRHTGPYGPPVARFWMERVAPWMAENDLFGRVRYGISHDDPTITDPASVATTPASRPSRRRCSRASRCAPCCPAAATPARASKAPSTTSMPPGSVCSPAGCPRAACSSMRGRMLEHYPVDIEVRPADRRVRLQHLHSGGAAVTDGSRRRLTRPSACRSTVEVHAAPEHGHASSHPDPPASRLRRTPRRVVGDGPGHRQGSLDERDVEAEHARKPSAAKPAAATKRLDFAPSSNIKETTTRPRRQARTRRRPAKEDWHCDHSGASDA